MPNDKWKIKNQSDVTGPAERTNLVGCYIRKNDDQTAYEFGVVLAQTSGTRLPTVPFSFPQFTFDGYQWTITVNSLADPATGTWNATAITADDAHGGTITGDDTGTWTAQAGQGTDDLGEEDAAAASA